MPMLMRLPLLHLMESTVSVSGTVGGDVKDGDTVTIDINGNIYTSLVAGGTFTITGVDAQISKRCR